MKGKKEKRRGRDKGRRGVLGRMFRRKGMCDSKRRNTRTGMIWRRGRKRSRRISRFSNRLSPVGFRVWPSALPQTPQIPQVQKPELPEEEVTEREITTSDISGAGVGQTAKGGSSG